jgi:hypothetical protein
VVARERGLLPPESGSRPLDGSGIDRSLSGDPGSDRQDADGAPLYALEIGGPSSGGVVCDPSARPLAFTDPATCQAVAALLAAAQHPPLRAPVPVSRVAGARVVATDEEAHAALLELLDDLAALRAEIAAVAMRC